MKIRRQASSPPNRILGADGRPLKAPFPSGGGASSDTPPTTNADKFRATVTEAILSVNEMSSRAYFAQGWMDPRRNIYDECGLPRTSDISIDAYQDLYDREAIAARVVEVLPRECWQVQPTVYEEERGDVPTPFEATWDMLGSQLRGEQSWFRDEQGSPVWEVLRRADEQSGIGRFGIIVIGIDDGATDLSIPVDSVLSRSRQAGKSKPKRAADPYDRGDDPSDRDPAGTERQYRGVSFGGNGYRPTGPLFNRKAANGNGHHPGGMYRFENGRLVRNAPPLPPNGTGEDPFEKMARGDTTGVGPVPSRFPPPKTGTAPRLGDPADPFETMATGDPTDPEPASIDPATLVPPGLTQLLFLRVFPETLVNISQFDSDPTSPRFGQPVMYSVTFNDPRDNSNSGIGLTTATRDVHWTRVVHLADARTSSEVFATPRQRPVINNLLGLQKLYGGSPEMYWRGAFPGWSIESNPQMGADVTFDTDDMRDQMENYFNGLQRYLALMGFTAKSLAPQVVDPTQQIAVQLEAICIKIACPIRVFKGSERGELASSQDDAAWNDRLKERQQIYLTPRVIVPLVDRLIAMDVLPEPRSYSVEWPDLSSTTESEKATVAATKTGALAQYVGGGIEQIMPLFEYLTRIWGMEEDEATSIVEAARRAEEEAMMQQQEMAAQGLGPDGMPLPTGPEAGGDPSDPFGGAAEEGDDADPFEKMSREEEEEEESGPPPFGGGPPKPFGGKPGGGGSPFGRPPAGPPAGPRRFGGPPKKRRPSFNNDGWVPLTNRARGTWNEGGDNCGIGPGGFQPGNTCGKGGSATLVKMTSTGEKLYSAVRGEDKVWRVAGKEVPEHLRKLGIPPAWKNVAVNLNPKGDLMASGVDAKGRVQMKYSDSHTARQGAAKFGRVRELLKKRASIFRELDRDARDPELRDRAECLKVVMQTGMRPGSDDDTKADHESFGATTLQGRHVVDNKDGTVTLRLVTGKNKGREVDFPVSDRATAAMLLRRADTAGKNGRLFATDAGQLRSYSKTKDGGGFKTKDHRTALGTETALEKLKTVAEPKTKTEYKRALKEVATVVAKTLGNTPAVALKSYIDPHIFVAWRKKVGL